MIPDAAAKSAAIRERMRELAGNFLLRCSGEVTLLRGLVARSQAGDTAASGELEHLAHRMCGTGALLGFESLSARAGDLERLVRAAAQAQSASRGAAHAGGTAVAVRAPERLLDCVAALETEVGRLLPPAGVTP
jgi:HPt (histidine-containing phosphotransfer) domain-containing protein